MPKVKSHKRTHKGKVAVVKQHARHSVKKKLSAKDRVKKNHAAAHEMQSDHDGMPY